MSKNDSLDLIAIICFAIFFGFNIILASFLGDTLFIPIILFFTVFGLVGIVVFRGLLGDFIASRRLKSRLQNLAREDWKESVRSGAVKESKIHRDLTETEVVLLQRCFKETGDKKYYLDSRSPVFSISGRLTKNKTRPMNPELFRPEPYFFVRGIKITPDRNSLIKLHDQEFREDEEVTVEFSPRSKYVWKMYKTEDLK